MRNNSTDLRERTGNRILSGILDCLNLCDDFYIDTDFLEAGLEDIFDGDVEKNNFARQALIKIYLNKLEVRLSTLSEHLKELRDCVKEFNNTQLH